jgi:UDP-2,4-diacetamido-2,4,6-trideoxy-beta-L-altropyranose hydrolase
MTVAINRTLLIRADGYPAIGAGHVMRCLALAQAWQDAGGAVQLAAARLSDVLRLRLEAEGLTVIMLDETPGTGPDAEATAACAREIGAAWVVADSYEFGAAFQRSLKQAGLRLLLLDDYGHAEHYHADIVLNQNLHADPATYENLQPYTRLLLGTRYVLLRREFAAWTAHERWIPEVARHLLVTLGGDDLHDLTALAIRAIQRIHEPAFETTVVTASDELHARLAPLAGRGAQHIEILGHVTRMPKLMAHADLAIAAAGSTSWERALLRLPSLVITVAENQLPIARALEDSGAARDLGWWHDLDEASLADFIREAALDAPLRRQHANAARQLLDCRGASRDLQEMNETDVPQPSAPDP